MKITVAGMGYVGLSNAILLAQHHTVKAMEIIPEKVDLINQGISPIVDAEISEYLANVDLDLKAYSDPKEAYEGAELVVVAAPTNYDDETNHFDTSAVESVFDAIVQYAPQACVLIKSTIPVGYTAEVRKKYPLDIIFSPEFLREGRALYDNLYPSRVIVGNESTKSAEIAQLFVEGAKSDKVEVLLMPSTEAEAVKLFSNTYLALRISYFNELDTYSEVRGLDTLQIVKGVGLDPRIGDHYNNPSFGYGGYCLPKDTKQLLANYKDVPNNLIQAIVESNTTRKEHITSQVILSQADTIGIYRLTMKSQSDNYRQSAIIDIMHQLKDQGKNLIIFEPTLDEEAFEGIPVVKNFENFCQQADIILANRRDERLASVTDKVYSRDLFGNN